MTKLVSFTAAATQENTFQTTGVAVVTFQGKTVELEATQRQMTVGTRSWTETSVRGFAARYATGSKLWPATVLFNDEGKMTAVRAGLDHRTRHNTASLVGLWSEVAEQDASQHIGA